MKEQQGWGQGTTYLSPFLSLSCSARGASRLDLAHQTVPKEEVSPFSVLSQA
jgi:hypothetical protein